MVKNPCKGCTFRQTGCHCNCKLYEKFKADVAEAQEKYRTTGHNKSFEEYLKQNRQKYVHRKGMESKQGRSKT